MKKLVYIYFFSALLASASAHSFPAIPADYNWQGVYIGGEIGGDTGTARRDFSTGRDNTTGNFTTSGIVGGGTVGYNWSFGNTVLGIEGDISGSGVSGDASCPNRAFDCKVDNDWLGTLRPRIGYSLEGVLPYLTGGLAVGDVHSHSSSYANGAEGTDFTDTKAGWTLGGGIELPFYGNWTTKLEYLFVRFDDANGSSRQENGSMGASDVSLNENIVRVGINYKF